MLINEVRRECSLTQKAIGYIESRGFMEAALSGINEAVSETEKYIADHHEEMESYPAYKRSEE